MKHGHNNEPRRIVVGVDGFESSKAALRWAIHLGICFPSQFMASWRLS